MNGEPQTHETAVQAGGLVAGSQRSKRRRNVVGSSKHRDDYVRLMKAGWGSNSLERYAALRYGEDIPARTFRAYRQRTKIETVDSLHAIEPDSAVDVLTEQARLIGMQKERIAIDLAHERAMSKLFSSTKAEVALLGDLLGKYKESMQDLGLFPKAGEHLTVDSGENPRPQDVPMVETLGQAFGANPEASAELARVLHAQFPKQGSNGSKAG